MKLVFTQKVFGAKVVDGVIPDYVELDEFAIEKIRLFGTKDFLENHPEFNAIYVCKIGPPKSEYKLE